MERDMAIPLAKPGLPLNTRDGGFPFTPADVTTAGKRFEPSLSARRQSDERNADSNRQGITATRPLEASALLGQIRLVVVREVTRNDFTLNPRAEHAPRVPRACHPAAAASKVWERIRLSVRCCYLTNESSGREV